MYQSNHNRNSIDNNNMPVISTVHYDSGYANAFWSGRTDGVWRRIRLPIGR